MTLELSHDLDCGTLVAVDHDGDVVPAESGDRVIGVVGGEDIVIPYFPIQMNQKVSLGEIRNRKFPITLPVMGDTEASSQDVADAVASATWGTLTQTPEPRPPRPTRWDFVK